MARARVAEIAIAPPTVIRMSSAAAKKSLNESEKRGGCGGGSFRPLTIGPGNVVGLGGGRSVALIFRSGRGRILLAVFVPVRQGSEGARVDRDRERLAAREGYGDRHARLRALLVP